MIAIFGSFMVFSAGSAYAEFRYGDSLFFLKRQVIWLILGIGIMIFASRIKPSFYFKATPYLYAITLMLLVLVLAVGLVGNGAQRWISIGPITVQPSEIAKLTPEAIPSIPSVRFAQLTVATSISRAKG